MSKVTDGRKPTPPAQPQILLSPRPYRVPEPLRNIITRHSQNVQIKCEAIQMPRAKRPTPTLTDKNRLLRLGPARSESDDTGGPADIAEGVDEIHGPPRDFRIERIDLTLSRVSHARYLPAES